MAYAGYAPHTHTGSPPSATRQRRVIAGADADLAGIGTMLPPGFAVAIGAGSAVVPGSLAPVRWLRSRVSAPRR